MANRLNAQLRTETGKGVARTLRREGRVPGVVYGHGDENRPLTIDALELQKLVSSINVENTLIDLKIEGVRKATSALIREVQYHPARPEILHVDLYQVHAGEKISLDVPIRLHGTPAGVREDSGILQETLRELHVECLPKDIPEGVDIDVSELRIGDSVHVSDVSLPDVKIMNDPELVICAVTPPTKVELPETGEAAEGEAEPEVIGERGEEGEEAEAE